MTKYELVYLVAPDASEEKQNEIAERMKGYVEQKHGVVESLELWEKRALAYEIKKQNEAFYYILRFEGDGNVVDELERRLRVADEVIRFLTIRKDEEIKATEKRKSYYQKKKESLDSKKNYGAFSDSSGKSSESTEKEVK